MANLTLNYKIRTSEKFFYFSLQNGMSLVKKQLKLKVLSNFKEFDFSGWPCLTNHGGHSENLINKNHFQSLLLFLIQYFIGFLVS